MQCFCFYDSLIRLVVRSHNENPYDKSLQCMRLIHFKESWKDPSNFHIEVNEILVEGGHRISFDIVEGSTHTNLWVYEDTDNVTTVPGWFLTNQAFNMAARQVLQMK